jgi:hypothetical protein
MAVSYAGYSVYTYATGEGEGEGMVGRIKDAGGQAVTPYPGLRKEPLNGDPKVEGVAQSANDLQLFVTDYVKDGNQAVYVYDVAAPALLKTIDPGWPNVENLYTLVKLGDYLYAIDYDNACVTEINATTFEETSVSYTLDSSLVPTGHTAYGQALLVIGNTLFGLFSFADSSWENYASSMLVRFTVSGGTSITVKEGDHNNSFAGNAFAMAALGNDVYVASIGGKQGSGSYNAASRIQSIDATATDLSKAVVTDIMQPSSTYPYEFRDISFQGSTAYILMGAFDASWKMTGKLVKTTDFQTFTTVDDFSSGEAGYFWAAQYTTDNNRIWFVRGNAIRVYDASNMAKPDATLTLTPGSLITADDNFDNINDFAFVGAYGATMSGMRGYRSPLQASRTAKAVALRAITQGRPEATAAEMSQIA